MPSGAVWGDYALRLFPGIAGPGKQRPKAFFILFFMAQNHSFSVELACKVGVEGAILLGHFYFLQQEKAGNEKQEIEGVFVKRSVEALTRTYPYFTTKMLKRIIANLEEEGYLFSRIKNDNSYDRSKSYTLSTEALDIFNINRTQKQETTIVPNRQMENSKQANDISPNGPMLGCTDISTFIIHNNTVSANAQRRVSSNNLKPSNLEEEPLKEKVHQADVLQKSLISGQAVAEHLGLSNRQDLIKAFDVYLEYRKEMKFKKYATVQTAAAGMKLLKECAERSRCTPMEIVDQTRANLWQGLQDLKRAPQPKAQDWNPKKIPAYAPDHEQPF